MFSEASRFCLQHHYGRIRVWRHRGDCTLAACICHRHTGPSPGVMSWDVIGYTSRSLLVRIDGTLNSARYISSVL
ncbi:transposable element Tcb1 transposase [Trichonephila clavipes]|nr:transposable element Tcb1 transposase [Trichonephila clavipes]